MKEIIKVLKAQGLYGKVTFDYLVSDIQGVLCDLPMTANTEQIKNYLKKQDEQSN